MISNITNYHYQNVTYANKSQNNCTGEAEFSQSVNRSERTIKESAVKEYITRHPESAAHVHQQVSLGKKFLAGSGADAISREDMSMDEYKSFIMGLLYSVPFDSTRRYDREIISISEKGWEQMKNDSDYEAWVFGYTVENRSVRNPFAGWFGMSGSFCIEKFGASIEEHHGQSFPMQEPGRKQPGSGKDEESWWDKRQKRSKEYMKKQIKKARLKRKAQQIQEQEIYQQRLWEGRGRLEEYFDRRVSEIGHTTRSKMPSSTLVSALLAYDRNIRIEK